MAPTTPPPRNPGPGVPEAAAAQEPVVLTVDAFERLLEVSDARFALVLEAITARTAPGPLPAEMAEFVRSVAVIADRAQTTAPKALNPEQERAMLSYRLIRNGLGNFGGTGDGFDHALLAMAQFMEKVLIDDRVRVKRLTKLAISDLPSTAKDVRMRAVDLDDKAVELTLPAAGVICLPLDRRLKQIGFVEVLDGNKVPVAGGLPAVVDTAPASSVGPPPVTAPPCPPNSPE